VTLGIKRLDGRFAIRRAGRSRLLHELPIGQRLPVEQRASSMAILRQGDHDCDLAMSLWDDFYRALEDIGELV
jgi:hypothetical protein